MLSQCSCLFVHGTVSIFCVAMLLFRECFEFSVFYYNVALQLTDDY